MWTINKFLNPEGAARIFTKFYSIPGLESVLIFSVAILQLFILVFFFAGVLKKYSYGLVLLMHAGSTFSTYQQYLNPFQSPNLLFFAAWPMLAACVVLFLFRDEDKLFQLRNK